MRYLLPAFCLFALVLFTACGSGVRDLDFINKQFQVTYNLDSTRTIDSTQLTTFRNATATYTFTEDGRGMNHVQMGMLSTDVPFTWTLNNDSLTIDQSIYTIRKQYKGFVLINDSTKLILSQQP